MSLALALSCLLFAFVHAQVHAHKRISPKLPKKIIAGYASWEECDDKILTAAINGCNVIIWFQINLAVNTSSGLPLVTGGPNFECVANISKILRDMDLPTIHLISVGGWDAPHPDTSNSALEVYENWNHWNTEVVAYPEYGFYGFDGIDWDIEGNDDPSNSANIFTVACLDLMGKFSQYAKQDNYIVSLVPPESYFDITTSEFSRSLEYTYPEYDLINITFPYHGRNCYAYIASKYGKTILAPDEGTVNGPDRFARTFDFITVQIYEGYSHALYNISYLDPPQDPGAFLEAYITQAIKGWQIDFDQDKSIQYPSTFLELPRSQLVIGLANGWADSVKFLFIDPDVVRQFIFIFIVVV